MTYTTVVLIVLLAFGFGCACGYLLGRSVHLERVTTSADASPDPTHVRETVEPMRWLSTLLGRRGTLVVLLAISLLLSAAATFLNVTTAGRVSDVVDCGVEYNRANGEARDERAVVSRQSTRSELRLWRDLRTQIGSQGPQAAAEVLASIDRRIRNLREVLESQTDNPYPDPDACDDGRFVDTEETQEPTQESTR